MKSRPNNRFGFNWEPQRYPVLRAFVLSNCYLHAVGLRVPAEEDEGVGAVGQVGYLEGVVGAADAVAQGTVVLVFADGDGVGIDGDVDIDAAFLEAAVDKEVCRNN